jgi:hypothetical protein
VIIFLFVILPMFGLFGRRNAARTLGVALSRRHDGGVLPIILWSDRQRDRPRAAGAAAAAGAAEAAAVGEAAAEVAAASPAAADRSGAAAPRGAGDELDSATAMR